MGNIHLVTGFAGYQHITSADQAVFNALTFGDGQYVLDYGNKFAASIVSNNIVNVLDGDILMQGRHIRLDAATSVDLTIENGAQGYSRNDLIVARYTKDANTGIEDANLVVIKGTATQGDPADPEYTNGDVLSGAAINDLPLYRVRIDGLTISALVPLFKVTDIDAIETLNHYRTHTHAAADVGAVPTVAVYYNDAMSADDLIVPLAVIKLSATSNAELLTLFGTGHSFAYVRTAFYSKATTVNSRVQTAYSYTGTPVRMAIRMYNQSSKVWTPWREIAGTDYALPRDGSAPMTGNLSINNGTTSVASLIPYAGQLIVRNELDSKNRQDVAFGQGTLRFLDTVNSVTNAYDILHTGNLTAKTVGFSKVVTGTYTGTGTYGAANENAVALPAEPAIFMVSLASGGASYGVRLKGSDKLYRINATANGDVCEASWDADASAVKWYNATSSGSQMNTDTAEYVYAAIY